MHPAVYLSEDREPSTAVHRDVFTAILSSEVGEGAGLRGDKMRYEIRFKNQIVSMETKLITHLKVLF